MATYIHYERFCPLCKRYYEGKIPTCNKCNGVLKITNKWYVTFRTEEFGIKKQKKLGSYETKSAAERAYMEYSVSDNRPTSAYTFEMLVADVLLRQKSENKSSTYISYQNIYYNRLTKLLKVKVVNITEKELRKIYTDIKQSDYSLYTQKATWGALGHALSYASIVKNIDGPFKAYKRIKPISTILNKKAAWTPEQANKFLSYIHECYMKERDKHGKTWLESTTAIEHYMWYVFFTYLYYMANRRGEVIALKVNKINFKENLVVIDENITHKVLPEERKNGISFKTTTRKNNQALIEYMPPKVSALIKEYIDTLNLSPTDYLFFKTTPINPEKIRRKMAAYIKGAGVPFATPHQFRHTHASVIFASGASKIEDAYIVAQRLGHNVKYTLDVYGSLYKDREKEIINNLDL